MTHARFWMAAIAVAAGLMTMRACVARADTVFFDSFEDMDATDGEPVEWMPLEGLKDGTFDATTGDYVMTEDDDTALVSIALGPENMEDMSVRSRVHIVGAPGAIAVMARANDPERRAYQGGISTNTGNAYIGRNDPPTGNPITLERRQATVSFETDVMLQLDVFGNTLSLYVWSPDDPQPAEPFITAHDTNFATGDVALLLDTSGPATGTFRYVHVARDHSILDADATDDGRIDIDDLNAVRNNFGSVGPADGSLPGDTVPFDGLVNVDDLNAVRNSFGAGANIAVPEPGGMAGFVFAWLVMMRARGRKGEAR